MAWTDKDIDLIPALNRCTIALRVAAEDSKDGLERQRLRAIADTVNAELRMQQQKRGTVTPYLAVDGPARLPRLARG